MPVFSKTARVPYTAAEAFELVADVARYPQFIRWIAEMNVRDERVLETGARTCLAQSRVGFRGFTTDFSTQVVAHAEQGEVRATLVRGPFKHLRADWRLQPVSAGVTDIKLTIDYAFSNRVIALLAAANQDMAADLILKAFLDEAERRFSRTPGAGERA